MTGRKALANRRWNLPAGLVGIVVSIEGLRWLWTLSVEIHAWLSRRPASATP